MYLDSELEIDKNVCGKCFGESFIRKYIKKNGSRGKCSYCDKTLNILPFNTVIKIISEGFSYLFEDAADERPYDKDGEHGFYGNTYDLYDIFWDDHLGLLADESLNEDIKSIFDEDVVYGCKNEYHSFNDDCKSAWMNFQRVVKYQARFVFHFKNKFDNYSYIDPLSTLELVQDLIKELSLFTELKENTVLYRCRQHEKKNEITEAKHLASSPLEYSLTNGRMNPAGIAMFYCSKNKDITIKEVVDESDTSKRYFSTGIFRTKEKIKLVDLSHLPEIPSIFDRKKNKNIETIEFLKDFIGDVIKPIKETDSIIEYIPTQIITEYIRYNQELDVQGIMYPSSKNNGDKNIVLFHNHEESLEKLSFSQSSIKTKCLD